MPEAVNKGNAAADHAAAAHAAAVHAAASAARASAVSTATAATVLENDKASLSRMPGAADDGASDDEVITRVCVFVFVCVCVYVCVRALDLNVQGAYMHMRMLSLDYFRLVQ